MIKPGAAVIREGNAVETLIDGVSKLGRKVSGILKQVKREENVLMFTILEKVTETGKQAWATFEQGGPSSNQGWADFDDRNGRNSPATKGWDDDKWDDGGWNGGSNKTNSTSRDNGNNSSYGRFRDDDDDDYAPSPRNNDDFGFGGSKSLSRAQTEPYGNGGRGSPAPARTSTFGSSARASPAKPAKDEDDWDHF